MTTAQIYKGSIAFIVLQLIMVAAVVMYPNLVTGNIDKGPTNINVEDALQQVRDAGRAAMDARSDDKPAEDDPMKAMLDALKAEEEKKK